MFLQKLKMGCLVWSIMSLIGAGLLGLAKLYPEQAKAYLQSEAFLWTIIIITALSIIGMVIGFFQEMKSMDKKTLVSKDIGLPPEEIGMHMH